ALVMRGGKILYGDANIVGTATTGCDALSVCGSDKQACLTGEIGESLSALQTAVGSSIYPLFACGDPMNEPSCVPSRPTPVNNSSTYSGMVTANDSDGDGIPDDQDLCPKVFD